jgi:hypothetical protein
LEEDVLLQFDVFGDSLKLWVWRPGEPRPIDPLLSATDDAITVAGEVGIDYYTLMPPPRVLGSAIFRYVHVSDTPIVIPEPCTATLSAIFFAGVFAWQWRR